MSKSEDIEKELDKEELETAETETNTENTAEEETNAAEPEAEKELTVEEQLEASQQEVEQLKDQLLRKIAEFDNYRKRTLKEKTELILNGGEKTITSILPVLDDMERALTNMKQTEDVAAVLEGMELIYKKFIDILGKQGVHAIDTKDADFNVDLHEAIAQLPATSDEMKGKVVDCTKTGYTLNEKVIRHAQVVVGV